VPRQLQPPETVAANATIVGILVLALGASEFLDLRRWEEGLETACGLWLIASPFILGYADAGMLRYWHFVLGAAERAASCTDNVVVAHGRSIARPG
jgi:hypothetical protein